MTGTSKILHNNAYGLGGERGLRGSSFNYENEPGATEVKWKRNKERDGNREGEREREKRSRTMTA